MSKWNRRRFLRGSLKGAAVSVALPLLDVFLNDSGTAFANGAPIPLRFGTWSWGLGMSESIFVPKETGANFDLPEEVAALAPVQKHLNMYTNFHVFKDDAPNMCHHSGWVVLRSGIAPTDGNRRPVRPSMLPSRARSATRLAFAASPRTPRAMSVTASAKGGNTVTTPEWSPLRFYQRLFGDGFQDPNASSFTPDPRVLVRKSALSVVREDARRLERAVGAADRERLDQYFTGIRDLERPFDLQLTRPAPREACLRRRRPAIPQRDSTLISFPSAIA